MVEELSQGGCQEVSESEIEQNPNMDLDIKYWRSALIKDGQGPFLNPSKLKEKVK